MSQNIDKHIMHPVCGTNLHIYEKINTKKEKAEHFFRNNGMFELSDKTYIIRENGSNKRILKESLFFRDEFDSFDEVVLEIKKYESFLKFKEETVKNPKIYGNNVTFIFE